MGVIMNLKAMDLVYQGEVVSLTKNEFQILQVLFDHAGNIVSREDLMKELWNSDFFIDDNTLSVNVARLRKKLEAVGLKDFIETKKGVGYGCVMMDKRQFIKYQIRSRLPFYLFVYF